MPRDTDPTFCIPVVVLGSASSGKSSLVHYFMHQTLLADSVVPSCSHGVMFYSKTVLYNDQPFKFKIWDTSGDARYKFLLPLYYKSATVAIVTFAPDDEHASFEEAKKLIAILKAENNIKAIALVAMKSDLEDCVSLAEVNEFAKSLNLSRGILTMEASAKDGANVMSLFEKIAVACKTFDNNSSGSFCSNDYHICGVNSMPLSLMEGEGLKPFQNSIELGNQNMFKQEAESIYMQDKEFHPVTPLKTYIEDEYDSDTDSHQDLKSKRPAWIKDEEVKSCYKCGSSFNMFVRKHHCRACGNIFCSDCSSHFTTIPHIAYNKPVRVCNDCHKRLLH